MIGLCERDCTLSCIKATLNVIKENILPFFKKEEAVSNDLRISRNL